MFEPYLEFYRMKRDPFRLSPDSYSPYTHPSYKKALAYLQFAIQREEGFALITGRPGTGKTTLINDLTSGLDRHKVVIANLVTTQLKAKDLLHIVASNFHIKVTSKSKSSLLVQIEQFLRSRIELGKRIILIVDEAQGLQRDAIEELRLLSNLVLNNKPMMQIFLLGQEELMDLVQSPDLEQLRQRITVAVKLMPLTEEEVFDYIRYELESVGWVGDPQIENSLVRLVYHLTEGIPRRINLICGRLLLLGFLESKHTLTLDDLKVVVDELKSESLISDEGISDIEEILDLNGGEREFLEPMETADQEALTDMVNSAVESSESRHVPANISIAEDTPETHPEQHAMDIQAGQGGNQNVTPLLRETYTGAEAEDIQEAHPDQQTTDIQTGQGGNQNVIPIQREAYTGAEAEDIQETSPDQHTTDSQASQGGDQNVMPLLPETHADTAEYQVDADYVDRVDDSNVQLKHQLASKAKNFKKGRLLLQILSICLYGVVALLIFSQGTRYLANVIDDEATNGLDAFSKQLTEVLTYHNNKLSELAADSVLSGLLAENNALALRYREKELLKLIPSAIAVRLLPYQDDSKIIEGISQPGETGRVVPSVADSDMRMSSKKFPQTDFQLRQVVLERQVLDRKGVNLAGTISLSFSLDEFQAVMDKQDHIVGYIELQQVGADKNVEILAFSGDSVARQGDAMRLTSIQGTVWQLGYWPPAGVIWKLRYIQFKDVVILVLLSMAVVIFSVIVFSRNY